MNKSLRVLGLLTGMTILTACGTTYQVPEVADSHTSTASRMFAEAQSEPVRKPISQAAAEQRFNRVARRVAPVGQSYCNALAEQGKDVDCTVKIEIDRKMEQRNAYFTHEETGPVIRLSMPLLQDSRNDDEVAFVMSHEYGHLLGQHVQKAKQQALAGAVIVGVITAAVTAQAEIIDSSLIGAGVGIGAAAGTFAYSQTYELESDTLGTYIADAAGYDPVKGAKYFARPEAARTQAGKLSFWGTHPPDEKRVATVLATKDRIDSGVALQQVQ
ncbi:TPR repeat-containing protein YfgC precursor [Falsiruegeria litorea R37]|uniref:TPR repeat-containing protein YfgC n=1 Tax=Falsiruegeria litorea R37 TaxID=1200284 RepID=A0A1Y5RZL1_9RHOB|nr:M48 family metalloprotease [Falsiruegeria litorea]SLN28146.1 TPR repeat-containing protein YfgC precursor [Falsiruegeria litorea R37]